MNSQLNDPLSRQRSPDWARPLQVLALLLCAGAAGCVIGDANPLGKACDESHPCPSPLACVDLVCAVAEGDAGGRDAGPAADAAVEPPDSSTDAPDSATEPPAGLDGGGRADADAVPPDAMVSDAAVAACPSGAVSSGCVCGSTFVSSGYCCGGIPRSSDCMRVRLDCGLASGTSTFDGKVFSPMLPYLTAGTAYDSDEGITGNYPIANTDYDALYQNETWVQTSSATFTIPVVNGNYTVHLHFVDWVHTGVGQRVFHVDLQGARILTDFDIVAEAGPSTALVKSFDVSVTGGAVTLTLTSKVVEPEIAAVEILPAGEPHLATTAAASCGPSDGVCPASCTYGQDPDCPAPSCLGGAVSSACACGSTVVTTGYCCSGTAQSTPCAALPAAFYVSPTGDDGNAGTSESAPFRTLEKARDSARASATVKTVYLLGGTFTRTATLELGPSDAGQSWLAYPGQTPVLEGGGTTVTAIGVQADHVTIRWLVIQNFSLKGIETTGASDVTIDSNTIKNINSTSWNQAAIEIYGTFTNGRITHNLIQGAGYAGIEGNALAGHDISNVLIDSNAIYDTMRTVADGGAIYYMDRGHSLAPMTISNNIIGVYGGNTGNSIAIYLDDMISNVTVEKNITFTGGSFGVMYHGGDHNVVRNNIFDLSQGGMLAFYQDIPGTSDSTKMVANVFTCNIVYSSASLPNQLWNYSIHTAMDAPAIHDNLYWGTNGSMPNGDTRAVDSSPLWADPHFVDPANANYGFQSGPPMPCFQVIDTSQVGPLPH